MIRAYLDTIWTTLTQPIVSGLMHLPIIPISINYQDRFLACQYLSAPVFFKIFLTSLHHNETLKAKKRGIFKNDLLFCKNEYNLAHGIQQPIPKLHFVFSSGQTASAKSKLRKLWRNFCAKTLTDKMKRILKKKSGFEFWNWLPDSFC